LRLRQRITKELLKKIQAAARRKRGKKKKEKAE
jgi:hypothetical protein